MLKKSIVLVLMLGLVSSVYAYSMEDVFELPDSGLLIMSCSATGSWQPNPLGMFQPGCTVFADPDPVEVSVQCTVKIDDYVELVEVGVGSTASVMFGDGTILIRAISGFQVEAYDEGTEAWVEILNQAIAPEDYMSTVDGTPYVGGEGGSPNNNYAIDNDYATTALVTSRDFRFTFLNNTQAGNIWGPWIDEVDGFIPEPMTLSLLGLGGLALLRRRK